MTPDLERLLGWALTLFNFSVTAVVAWVLTLVITTHSLQPQVVQIKPLAPVSAFNSALGFVGLPTAYVPAESLPAFAGSAVVGLERGGTLYRPY